MVFLLEVMEVAEVVEVAMRFKKKGGASYVHKN